jgi:hypothetical protein
MGGGGSRPLFSGGTGPLFDTMALKKAKRVKRIVTTIIFLVIAGPVLLTMLGAFLGEIFAPSPPTHTTSNNMPPSYNTPLHTSPPAVLTPLEFTAAALKAGYAVDRDENYDGFFTLWVGAMRFDDGVEQVWGNHTLYIGYTQDRSVSNARIEYNNYVGDVKAVGGKEASGSGVDYQWQFNMSEYQIGIAYRIGDVNMFVVADIKYADEVLAFFDAIGFGIPTD